MLSVETLLVLGGTAIACFIILATLAAWAWVHWLKLRAREIELSRGGPVAQPHGLQRIDLADLKERVRKLEAIASGVDF